MTTSNFRLSLPLSCGGRLFVQGYRASEQQVPTDLHQMGNQLYAVSSRPHKTPPRYRQTKSIWALCAGATRMAHWELSRVEAGSSAWLAPATCHILWEELGLRIGTRNCQGVQCPGSVQPTRHGTKNTRFACAPNIARSIELFVKERTKPIRAIFSRKERGPPFIQSVSQLGCMWKDAVEPCKQGVRIQDRVVDCRWSKSIYTPLLLVSISVVLRFGSGSQQLQLSDVAWTMM